VAASALARGAQSLAAEAGADAGNAACDAARRRRPCRRKRQPGGDPRLPQPPDLAVSMPAPICRWRRDSTRRFRTQVESTSWQRVLEALLLAYLAARRHIAIVSSVASYRGLRPARLQNPQLALNSLANQLKYDLTAPA
jgi:hypothetical protein